MSSEASDLGAMIERIAREGQGDLDRAHGQHLLDMIAARGSQGSADDPLLKALNQAHQARMAQEGSQE
jgi:hypothetical protein